jgi:hypothetical protein
VSGRFRQRLVGLTDDEVLWEPVAGCWSVRLGDDGNWHADREMPPPDPEPVTTIGWRAAHIADLLSRHPLRSVAFGGVARDDPPEQPHDAATVISDVESGIADWAADLAVVPDDRWLEPLGPGAGRYGRDPVAAFVLHIHTEFVHHSAEIALLRDLYRQ